MKAFRRALLGVALGFSVPAVAQQDSVIVPRYNDLMTPVVFAADPERSLIAARGLEDRRMVALLEDFPPAPSSSVGASKKRAP